MGDVVNLLGAIKGAPTEITVFLAVMSAFVVLWLRAKDADVAGATSIGKLQIEQMQSLMAQNKILADDLSHLRQKMAETYTLMETMRDRIVELEELVRTYKRKCDDCPGPSGKANISTAFGFEEWK
jgi:hypothetical protein